VTSSDGTPGRGRFSVSPAARYREMRANRTIYVLALLALLAPWVLWLQQLQVAFAFPGLPGGPSAQEFLREQLLTFGEGTPLQTFDLFVAAALGVALFSHDRGAGGLLFSLEGPLSRREVWLAKLLFGSAILILVRVLGTAANLAAAAASGNLDLWSTLLLNALAGVTGQLMFFATALAMGGAMATAFVLLATLLWMGLPGLLQGLGMILWPAAPLHPWILALANFSPFQPFQASMFGGGSAVIRIAWFLVWTAAMVWLGARWWDRAAYERLNDGFFFPFLWNLYYAFLSLVSGLIVTTVITRGQILGLGWAAIYAAFFVAGWFFWRWGVTLRGRWGHLREPWTGRP